MELSKSPDFVYLDQYGERNPRCIPDKRGSLGRAAQRWADDRGGTPRADFEKFQNGAEKEGLVLDKEAFRAWLGARKELAEGGEHTVYLDVKSQRVVKITHPDVLGDGSIGHPKNIRDYLANLRLHNREFGDDIRLEGIVNLHETPLPQVVISQPRIRSGRPASLPEKIAYFKNRGFSYDPKEEIFVKSRGGETLKVGDHDGDNVLARDTKKGVEVYPIDTQLLPSGGWKAHE